MTRGARRGKTTFCSVNSLWDKKRGLDKIHVTKDDWSLVKLAINSRIERTTGVGARMSDILAL